MTSDSEQTTQLSPLKRAFLALEQMQAKLDAADAARREPVAIVGLGCRFPGGPDPDAFWQLLRDGRDAIGETPPDRWDIDAYYDPDPDAPGKMSTRWGGFLDRVDRFDPQFFGITPREAITMDPQQRLLLEVSREALEQAAIPADSLFGSRTGVFVGIVNNDYSQLQLSGGDNGQIDAYFGSGSAHSIASGRLSYLLGLRGPSISIDTACSASLVAVHLAVQSLRLGECDMAIVGGTNVILVPETTIALSKFHMMAPDGRCKAFDARADGFVRGEGCGVVILKRQSDALADGDNIIALIRGSAVNQDGPSSGLTAPSGPAQEAVIREALANGGVEPGDVTYVEAHGTGTTLGDPIEVQALAAALGPSRSAPVLIGSVKTNIGHLESAAGIAGLIKAALALRHRAIPPSLHLQEPNPFIPWSQLPVTVVTQATPWPDGAPRVAGVSSFGFSGTNAHIVLEAAPEPAPLADEPSSAPSASRPLHLLTLSARHDAALRELAGQFHHHLTTRSDDLADVAYTANSGREHLSHRLALIAASKDEARQQLAAVAAGDAPAGVVLGRVHSSDKPKIAFLFTGQGSQYAGMARQLYQTQPAFRAALDQCDQLLRPHLDRPLLDVLFDEPPAEDSPPPIDQTGYTQPALFAVEYALARLWQSWGVEPNFVMGHSVGEYVAACLAGVFSLGDGLKLIAARGRLMQSLPAGGRMVAILANEAQVAAAVAARADQVAIAAVNGPENVVISGAGAAVQAIVDAFGAEGVKSRPLTVSHAFHSPLMDPMLDEFARAAAEVAYAPPRLKLVSNVTGEVAGRDTLTHAAYWREHARRPVRFAAAIETLRARGVELFLEIGPHPTLSAMGQRCLPDGAGVWLPSLRRGRDDWQQMLHSLGSLYVHGAVIDWPGFDRGFSRRRLALPTYPFQRARYWIENKQPQPGRLAPDPLPYVPADRSGPEPARPHPLLGQRLRSALKESQFLSALRPDALSFLADHRVHGVSILPATGFIELALAAAASWNDQSPRVEGLIIREALLAPDDGRVIQTVLNPLDERRADFRVFSLETGDGREAWRLHAEGRLVAGQPSTTREIDLEAIRARCPQEVTAEAHYQQLGAHGLDFGPSLRGVERVWRRDGEALGEVSLPAPYARETASYQFHPALLDACLQVLSAALGDSGGDAFLPIGLDSFQMAGWPATRLWSLVTVHKPDNGRAGTISGDITVTDETGQVIAELRGLHLRRVNPAMLNASPANELDDWLYELVWRPAAGGVNLTALAERSISRFAALGEEEELASHNDVLIEVDKVATAYIRQALDKMGWRMEAGQIFETAELARQLGVAPSHHRLFARLLSVLAEDGLLEPAASGWRVRRGSEVVDPQTGLESLPAHIPATQPQLALTRRCGEQLAELLQGTADPLQIIFPGGSLDVVDGLYRQTAEARAFNRLTQSVVAEIAAQLPSDRPVRILEIGAGSGGTTSYLLPHLPADRTDYLFTDIAPLLVSKAAERFDGYPFLRAQILDIEQDPAQQGLAGQQFDLVLAVNVLHATADLRQSLRHTRQLLAPGGLLLVMEETEPKRWIDVTFGLTGGWWRFTDVATRGDYPLISRRQWLDLLAEAGFDECAVVPESSATSTQVLILARAAAPLPAEGWLILGDQAGVGEQLATRLRAMGHRCFLAQAGREFESAGQDQWQIDPTSPEDYRRLLSAIDAAGQSLGIIHLWSLDTPPPSETATHSLDPAQAASLGSVLYLVQALGSHSDLAPRLWLVTRDAQPAGESAGLLQVAQSPLWGLARVIELEHPELRCARVDLDGNQSVEEQTKGLLAQLAAGDEENQTVIRGQGHFIPRLERLKPAAQPDHEAATTTRPARLVTAGSGVLDGIALQPAERRPPGPGEVEIHVRAAGLNFRDVLNALAMREDTEPLGSECGGVVTAVGEGVDHLAVGDEVMAVAPGCFATFVTTNAGLVVKKPAHLSLAEVATFPMAFLTAHYALNHVAGIQAGERVLIHAAAGGVGLAAVQLAQRAGAVVFGTAGSPEKRAFLRSLGVQHVFDSRSLDFAAEIMTLTGGQGIDVVLNSLAGDFIPAGVSTLAGRRAGARGSRFLEIGKRDIWSHEQFQEARPEAEYHIIDLSAIIVDDPALIGELFAGMVDMIREGVIQPLPLQTFALSDAPAAFRFMAQARHTGKIVLTNEPLEKSTEPSFRSILPTSTVLITGGLAGLGLRVAQRLVEQGARHLVLMGRSRPSAAALETIAALEQTGARIAVVQGDVSRPEHVAAALEQIEATMPPLGGVIHSAGVLNDGVLLRQDWSRFSEVLAPKVDGAWNLHVLTRDRQLAFFVLFSSAAGLFGSSGQGNHAAANAFLDALAHHRRAQGLPALSINWGVWSEIGAAAERHVGQRVAEQGVGVIAPDQGLQLLEQLMEMGMTQAAVLPIDWPRYLRPYEETKIPAWLSPVAGEGTRSPLRRRPEAGAPEQTSEPAGFLPQLMAAPASGRREMLLGHVNDQVVKVVGLAAGQAIDPRQPLNELGLDSLMAVELRNLLGASLNVQPALPATLVFDYPTIDDLTDYLGRGIWTTGESSEGTPVKEEKGDFVDQIEGLSDEEVDRLFAELQGS